MSGEVGNVNSVLAEEQGHLDRLMALVTALRERSEHRYRETLRTRDGYSGGLAERDALVRLHAQRVAELTAASRGLLLGRLGFDAGDHIHVGRTGLSDEETGERVLVDWRAPAARPFYTATPANRHGVQLRRQLITSGSRITAVHDEMLGFTSDDQPGGRTDSPAALFAALEKPRTDRMADIVQTIQAEQDEIIRADLRGTLVVQGGPGTGKTAVALHRAAFLLYEHRDRLLRDGVLLVGPTSRFLRYISEVLPGLGESSVVLTTMSTLLPGIVADAAEPPALAALKGELRMAAVLRRAVERLQCRPAGDVELSRMGEAPIPVPGQVLGRIRRAVLERGLPHNEGRPHAERMLIDYVARRTLRALGYSTADLEAELPLTRAELAADVDVLELLDRIWPITSADDLLRSVLSSSDVLAAAGDVLDEAERAALVRDAASPWTPADVPLLDEAAELLGEDPRASARETPHVRMARRRAVRYAQDVLDGLAHSGDDDDESSRVPLTAEALADRQEVSDERTAAERATTDQTWTYGHVIVDEAQELSPMALRSLIRRASLRSMTLVGDMNQVSGRERELTWTELLSPQLPRWTTKELSVNYRTPAAVMSLAGRVLRRIDSSQHVPVSIREGSEHPLLLQLQPGEDAVPAVTRIARRLLRDHPLGTLAIIAPGPLVPALVGLQRAAGSRTWVGSAEESKGLEFDTVLLVEPGASTSAGRADLARLYVALTRATQRLVIVEHDRCAEDAFASSNCQGTTDDLTLERCTVNAWLRRGRPGA